MQTRSPIAATSSTTAARIDPPTEADVVASFRGAPHSFVDVGHSRLAYRRFGAGPDVVFVHGWPLGSATYRALVPHLAGSFTCHLLDLPYAVRSESDSDAPFDMLSLAAAVRRAADALGLTRFALVGQDSGGFIARLVAATDPRVSALVLANTEIPGYQSLPFFLFFAGVKLGASDLILRMMKSRTFRRSPLLYGGLFSDLDLGDGAFHELMIEPLLTSPALRRRMARVLDVFDTKEMDRLTATHAKIRCPSLLVWGKEDPFFPVARARAMLPQFGGGARLEEIPGAKLLVYEEQPRAFSEHALPFLKQHMA